VLVRAARHAETLVLDVEDDGPGAARSESRGLGIGLRATRERLALLYGTSAAVAAAPRPEGGYRVSVRLPLRRAAREAVAPPAHSGIEVGDARSHR
jgi:LytS/YehU family sensor histidine kinase